MSERNNGASTGRGLDANSLWQLVTVRFKEYTREPEAIFWSFGFPILLAIGLGIAFRNKPADVVHVAIVARPRNDLLLADTARRTELLAQSARVDSVIVAALSRDSLIKADKMSPDSADVALRTGRVALVVSIDEGRQLHYKFDDTRPDARTARLVVDDAIQRGFGRRDQLPGADQHVREVGSRYIDFVVPGLLGMSIMGGGIWGLGFSIVDQRRKKLLKRLV